jgi:tRNA C32,U32 (ribose-2'-O)-methylase TrmJ
MVIGTSARIGGLFRRQSAGPPEEILPRVIEPLRAGPAALVFGPEPSGLNNTEVARCHYLIHIPANPTYSFLEFGSGGSHLSL